MSANTRRTNAPHPEVPEFLMIGSDETGQSTLEGEYTPGVVFRTNPRDQQAGQASRFDCNELYAPCFKAAAELISTANKYSKKRSNPLLALTDTHSWTEVEASVLSACDSLDGLATKDRDMSGFTGKIKSAFRALCQRANVGLSFTSLIPDDVPCSSVLCGGLKIVFTALQQSSNYRDDVYKAIEELPFIVNDHAAYIRIEKQDEELHRRNAALHVALFRLIGCILYWFAKNPVVTGMKMLVNPQGFADTLKGRQADVQKAASRFEKHALLLHNQRHNDSMELQHWMAYEVHKTREDVTVIRARCEVLETISQLLQQRNDLLTAEKTTEAPSLKPKTAKRRRSTAELRLRLLRETDYDSGLINQDIANTLRHRLGSSRMVDEDRVVELRNHPQFHAWLSLDHSSVLLIDGRCESANSADVALVAGQISQLALRLYEEQTESLARVIPLFFFCSEHRNPDRDRFGHANAMIWMLLLQLVDRYEDFSVSDLDKGLSLILDGDTAKVCEVLSRLVSRLPRSVILLVVVEGLDSFLSLGRQEELGYVVQALVEIQRHTIDAKVKMMFTNTTASDFLKDVFRENEILRLPRTPRKSGSYLNLTRNEYGGLVK